MVREIVHDPVLLSRPSRPAVPEDAKTAQDLLDTLEANRERCVGMAANMIGVNVRIIVFDNEGKPELLWNPEIVKAQEPFQTEEGCLSLSGVRQTQRFRKIKVSYETPDGKKRLKTYSGWTAQIIQHEIDHLHGRLI